MKTFLLLQSNFYYKLFNVLVIFLSVCFFVLETDPFFSTFKWFFLTVELACLTVFVFDFSLNLFLAKNKWRYINSFYGWVDLLTILPAVLFFVDESIVFRILRLFKIFRIFKLGKFSESFENLLTALKKSRYDLIVFLFLAMVVFFFASLGIYFFERGVNPSFSSFANSLWGAIITLTTVGYGDIYPITFFGKLFTFFVLILSIGVITIPSAIVIKAFMTLKK